MFLKVVKMAQVSPGHFKPDRVYMLYELPKGAVFVCHGPTGKGTQCGRIPTVTIEFKGSSLPVLLS